MSSATRITRIAKAYQPKPDETGVIVADTRFAFDPQWYAWIAARPGAVLTLGGRPVLANVSRERAEAVRSAIDADSGSWAEGLSATAYEDGITIYNAALRKRERPFLIELIPANVRAIERASYFGAYKGVTDLLTKYLWPEWALVLTRIAARTGMTPNFITTIGAALCVWATVLFWDGHYWTGMAAGLAFMVLDTVDGKLARCTITSSWWGNIFDHGLDLVHPPFWWYAWGVGLGAHGLALAPDVFWTVMGVMVGGYVLQRLIEGWFIHVAGMHIHVWRKIDTDFRLITARRNPNMLILFVSLLFSRPDLGLLAVTGWTVLSLIFHFVRLLQAIAARRRGAALTSWLSDGSAA
ncbi:CDP-alcohol phosphatidyltransferase family protein [Sphingosinicella soli]|nr:CDP-alcohol phosphatidyltransferase family protein [Sphingosinicella soli]